jgi:Flp pilus assembly protein TadG
MREIFEQVPVKPELSFLGRLRKDVAGNTLMLVAGAILPLTAMIGAGVDMSRTYLVKSRLQQACDAGALATRQKLGGGASLTTDIRSQGTTFFNNNFDTGLFGTTGTTFTTGLDSDKQVTASASTNVPVSIMGMFGNGAIPINVRCDAKLEVANTDIMFVLDITGSMGLCPDGTNTCGNGGAGSRIEGLRSAVLDFYDVIAAASTSTSQLRFGFVPYSANVNLDGVLDSSHYVTNQNYESAVANMTTAANQPTPSAPVVTEETYSSSISTSECDRYGTNKSYPTTNDGATFNGGGPAPTATTVTTYSKKDWGAVSDTSGTNRTCRRNKSVTTSTYRTVYKFTNWTLKSVNYDVRDFIAGSSVNIANSNPTGFVETRGEYNLAQIAAEPNAGTPTTSVTWDKCVQERDTAASATFTAQSGNSYNPSGAIDMEINTLPTTQQTKWRPSLHQLAKIRPDSANVNVLSLAAPADSASVGSATAANNTSAPVADTLSNTAKNCPKPATKLAIMARTDVETYVNGLTIGGSTYHDAGMIWGARLISPTGIFASENATAANGKPIGRHIIFMTDGVMCPRGAVYSIQGYERASRRVMGSNAPEDCFINQSAAIQDAMLLNQRHKARFLAICEAAKAQNISVWTVAFGTDNPPNLVTCANPQQSFNATTTAGLKDRFAKIAAKIASLRISQ